MASWEQLVGYVKGNYTVAESEPRHITLFFDTGDERSQGVHLFHQTLGDDGDDWVQIESAICEASSERIEATARAAGDMVCGGVAVINDVVIFRHSVPLANLDVNEFVQPLELVTIAADRLEALVSGLDEF